jgi:hypothetical protein
LPNHGQDRTKARLISPVSLHMDVAVGAWRRSDFRER